MHTWDTAAALAEGQVRNQLGGLAWFIKAVTRNLLAGCFLLSFTFLSFPSVSPPRNSGAGSSMAGLAIIPIRWNLGSKLSGKSLKLLPDPAGGAYSDCQTPSWNKGELLRNSKGWEGYMKGEGEERKGKEGREGRRKKEGREERAEKRGKEWREGITDKERKWKE